MVRWVSVAAVAAAAVALRMVLDPWMGPRQPFVFVYIAVLVSTLIAGWRAAAVAGAPALLMSEMIAIGTEEPPLAYLVAVAPSGIVCACIIGLAEGTRRLGRTLDEQRRLSARPDERTKEGLRRSNRMLRLLVQASEELLTKDEPGEFLDAISRRLGEQLGLDVYFYFLLEPDGERLSLASYGGVSREEAARVSCVCLGEAVCGRVARTREPAVLRDVQDSADPWTAHVRALGLRAYVCHALVARGRVVGTLSFASRRPVTLDADAVALLHAVCDQAAIVLERKHSEEALRTSEDRYRAFITQSTEGIWRFEFDEPLPPGLPEDEQIAFTFRHAYLAECNEAMARQYGYERPEEIVGRLLGDFLLEHDEGNREYLRSFVRNGYRLVDAESREVDREGREHIFLNNLVGILDPAGRLLRAWGTQRDVTARRRAEAAYKETAERLRAIVDTAADGIITSDEHGTIESVNPAAQRIFGYAPEEIVGRGIGVLMPEPHRSAHPGYLAAYRSTGERRIPGGGREVRGRRKDGSELPLELVVSEMRLEGRTLYTGIVRDITERKRGEEALRDSEERHRTLIAQISDYAIYRTDKDGRAVSWNEGVRRVLGYEEAEFIGRDIGELIFTPEDREAGIPQAELRTAAATGSASNDRWMMRKGGVRFWATGTTTALRDASGAVIGFSKVMRDQTDLWRAQEDLRRAKDQLDLALEAADVGTWRINVATGTAVRDAGMNRLLGLEHAESRQPLEDYLERVHPEDRAATRAAFDESLRTGTPYVREHRIVRPDGAVRWLRDQGRVMTGDGGRPLIMTGAAADITARRLAEEALRENEWRLRLALETGRMGTWSWDVVTGDVQWTDMHYTLLGFRPGEIKPTFDAWLGRIHPEDAPAVLSAVRRAMESRGEYRYEYRTVHPDGSSHWIEARGRFEYAADGTPARSYGIIIDIDERRRAEQAVRESEERSRALSEATFDAILMHDKGVAIEINDSFTRMFGYTRDEVIGRDTASLLLVGDSYKEAMARIAANDEGPYEVTLRRKDGSTFIGELRARGIVYRGRPGRVVSCRDITAVRLAERELARHRDHLQEILRERTAALEESHNKLRLSERLAGLGTLAAGLGHDMGNLLLPLRTRLESIEAQPVPEGVREDVAAIRKAAEYLQRLTHGLRLLALDPDEATGAGTDLHDWWPDAEPLLRNALSRTVSLEHRFPPGPLGVALSRPGLTQAVFNLVQNAGQALRGVPEGRVTVWAEVVPAPASEGGGNGRTHAATPGIEQQPALGIVRIGVTDNGPGMTPEIARRCLEPFFTTKARTHATGMGLALVHATVQKVGGSIEVRSQPGGGSTFILSLPAAGRAGPPRDRPVAAVGLGDPRLRSFVQSLLHAANFRIVEGTPADGPCLWIVDTEGFRAEEALRVISAHPSSRIILVGDPPVDGTLSTLPEQIVTLGPVPKPAAMRLAIRAAAQACESSAGERGRAAG